MTGTSINDLKSYFSQTDGQIGLPKAPKDGEDSFTMVMAHAQGKNLSAMGASPEMKAPAQDFSKAAKQPDESSNPGARVNKNENLRRDLEDKKVSGDRTDDKTIDEEISERSISAVLLPTVMVRVPEVLVPFQLRMLALPVMP